jgi:hypothetical protein
MGTPFLLFYADPDGDGCAIRTDADVHELMRLSNGAALIKLTADANRADTLTNIRCALSLFCRPCMRC